MPAIEPMSPAQLLRWYIAAGVDEAIGEKPVDRFAAAARAPQSAAAPPLTAAQPAAPAIASSAAQLAASCQTLEQLQEAMRQYDGCALKRTCQNLVFADGNPASRLMIVGEAPGADEDRLGRPFVGVSGKLLDLMLAAIGFDRSNVYISNVIPWRPPGNRKPEGAEIELCLPFIRRHIALVRPECLLLLGGSASAALLGRTESITRLRGQWQEYQSPDLAAPIPALPSFHPAYLLRTPAHKREAWQDLLSIRQSLDRLKVTRVTGET